MEETARISDELLLELAKDSQYPDDLDDSEEEGREQGPERRRAEQDDYDDDSSSIPRSVSMSADSKTKSKRKKDNDPVIDDSEALQVRRLRMILLGMFIVAGAACTGVYFFVNSEAKNDYVISVSDTKDSDRVGQLCLTSCVKKCG